jgi:hypothetical protein
MADDVLAPLPPVQVAGFYSRLAASVDAQKGDLQVSLAALLMRHWLDNRDATSVFAFDAPPHLRASRDVASVLDYHRHVYRTEEKDRLGGTTKTEKWAGVLPRLQGTPPYPRWNGAIPLNIDYSSLCELPLRYQLTGNNGERDLLYALRGFQLKTFVTVVATPITGSKKMSVMFRSFEAQVLDRYDWDYSEHLTVPNPDYGISRSDAVAPKLEKVVVYHSNARRLEVAGLAAPYDVRTNRWRVTDASLVAPAVVDPTRSL